MPIRPDGRWESWETRKARQKAEAEAAPAPDVREDSPFAALAEELTSAQKAARTRARNKASKAAAEAAIADATGENIDIDAESESEDEEDNES